jgi:NAD(P)-dependent dehydrogenase (short-subunit alcohol dehydrogenase family)
MGGLHSQFCRLNRSNPWSKCADIAVGCDIKVDANNETFELVRRAGGEMTGIAPVDLTDPEQARKMVEDAVAAYGGLDVVYNNAAIQ